MTIASMEAIPIDLATDKSIVVPSFKPLAPMVYNSAPSLKRVPYIHHPICLKKNQAEVQALLDFGSDVNAMTSAYTTKPDLKVWLTNIKAQKIDDYILEMIGMVLASFQINDKLSKSRIF